MVKEVIITFAQNDKETTFYQGVEGLTFSCKEITPEDVNELEAAFNKAVATIRSSHKELEIK